MKTHFTCLCLLICSFCFSQKSKIPLREIYSNENIIVYLSKDNFINSETVFDAILKIPNISIDGKNNINCKNKPLDITIDGKQQNLPNSEIINYLKSIPIGIAYSIEIIENPNVFYNTETDFLINITTENLISPENLNLFNLSLIQDENLKLNSFINFKRAYKKFFFQINTAFSAGTNIDKKEGITQISNDLHTSANSKNTFTSKNRFFLETTLFYDLNFRDKIGLNFKHYSSDNSNKFDTSVNFPEPAINSLNNQRKIELNDLELYYLQKLDKGGTKFKMSGSLSSFETKENSKIFNDYQTLDNFTYDFSKIGSITYKKELFSADLIIPTTYLPFTLNTGFEYFKNTNTVELSAENYSTFIVQQKNLYVLLGKRIDKFSFQIGLKVAKNKSQIDTLNIIKNTYEFLSSTELSYQIDEKNKINLSYARKINQTNTLFINKIFISNSNFTNVNSNVLYNTSNNALSSFSYLNYNYLSFSFSQPNYVFLPFYDSRNNNTAFHIIHNPQYYNAQLSFPLTENLFKLAIKKYLKDFDNYSFSLTTGYNFLNYDKKVYTNYFLSINGTTKLMYDINLLINTSLITKNDFPYGSNNKNLYKLDFALNKYFLSENLNISININDLFNTFNQSTTYRDEMDILNINNSFNLQKVTVSAIYNFSTILKFKKNKKL